MNRLRGLLSGWKRETALFVLCFVALCALYEFGRVMRMPPLPTHIWRQSDCLSITTNLYNGQGSFLEPEMHSHIADHGASGRTAGEAPVLYWLVARIWRITGPSEFAYRSVGLLFLFAGLLALFRSLRLLGLLLPWALGLTLLVFTSPALIYYSIGFLTDVPAFAMALIGFYFVIRNIKEQRRIHWILAMLVFAIGASMKVTAGLGLLALLGAYALWCLYRPSRTDAKFPEPRFGWAVALLALAPVVAWYVHADHYNQEHGGRYTFNGFWPLWKMTPEEVDRALGFAKDILVFQILDTSVWVLVVLALVVAVTQARRWPPSLVVFNALLFVGTCAYVILWFNALDRHDYYFINPLILPLALLVSACWWMHQRWPRLASSKPAMLVFLLLVGYNIVYARNNIIMRSNPRGVAEADLLPVYHPGEPLFWSAEQWGPLDPLIGMDAVLDSAGIPRNALVAVPEDGTINAALYLLRRPGLTGYGGQLKDTFSVERFIAHGGHYLVSCRGALGASATWMRPYLTDTVLTHRGAVLYDLSGLPFTRYDTLLLGPDAHAAPPMVVHLDTVACAVRVNGHCFGSDYLGFAVDNLPLDGHGCSIINLEISGAIRWDRPKPHGGHLTLFQYDMEGAETIDNRVLPDGPFSFTLLVDPARASSRANLLIENQTGGGYRLELHEIRARRLHRPWN